MAERNFENEFAKKHPDRAYIIRFMREALGKKEIVWSDLTTVNLLDVCDYFKSKMAANSAKTYFATLNGFIKLYADEFEVPCKRPHDVLKVKRDPSENVVLSTEEIGRIENYVPQSRIERNIKAQFLCEYYCMARTSDIQAMTMENIRDGYITYVSKKTHTVTKVPLHKNFIKYFKERGKTYTRCSYNRTLKSICEKVGINEQIKLMYRGHQITVPKYQLIASHTARRSAATELAKRNVPLTTISKLMGHSDVKMTARYIITDIGDLDDGAISFFNGL